MGEMAGKIRVYGNTAHISDLDSFHEKRGDPPPAESRMRDLFIFILFYLIEIFYHVC